MEAETTTPFLRRLNKIKLAFGAIIAACLLVFVLIPAPPKQHLPKRIPVVFWHLLGAEWEPSVNEVVRRFNASQDKYEVIPLLLPSDGAESKFFLSVVGGDPPDLMLQWTQAISSQAADGILQPLDTMMTPHEKTKFLREAYPIVRKMGWYKGHLYGFADGYDFWACYYRPDYFREAGLDPDHFPKTLEELTAVGQKLHRFDKQGNITRIGFIPTGLLQFIPAFGGRLYDEKTGALTINTPENLRALEFLGQERKRLGFDKVLRYNAGLTSDSSGATWPFISGAFSVMVDGEWRVQQMAKFAPNIEYRVMPIPPPAGGKALASACGPNAMTIPKGAKHPEGAWEFLKYMVGLDDPVTAAEFYVWFSWMPLSPEGAKPAVYQEFLNKYPQYRTFLKIAESENNVLTPPVPDQLYITDRLQEAEDAVNRGTLTAKEALEKAELQVKRERARRKELGYAAD